MRTALQYLLTKLNQFSDWLLQSAQKDPEVSYKEYQDLVKERKKLQKYL